MNIDLEHLRRALFLATGQPPTQSDLEVLAGLLDVPDEALPHLFLKVNGFAGCSGMTAALNDAVKRHPAPPQTRRKPGVVDWARVESARKAVADALREVIDKDLADHGPDARLNEALGELAGRRPYGAFDAHHRIRG